MSRIGRRTIEIKDGVTVVVDEKEIKVKGPKGELIENSHPLVKVEIKDKEVVISVNKPDNKSERSLWGLYNALITNMIIGVTEGFSKILEINGVGYKVEVQGKKVILNVGYSHPVEIELPADLEASVEKNILTIAGNDKQKVGAMAAKIRKVRKPEPYKGKGIKYIDEHIIRKAGKQAKTAE